MSALDTLPDTQSSKVGKTEKSEPAIVRHKSPFQRRYEDVRRASACPAPALAFWARLVSQGGVQHVFRRHCPESIRTLRSLLPQRRCISARMGESRGRA
jgi:hypothetical protein